MWQSIKCILGFHDWEVYTFRRWGEDCTRRRCRNLSCRAWQRWLPDKNDSSGRRGRWV